MRNFAAVLQKARTTIGVSDDAVVPILDTYSQQLVRLMRDEMLAQLTRLPMKDMNGEEFKAFYGVTIAAYEEIDMLHQTLQGK